MKQKIIYLDNAATTKVDDAVLREMLPFLKEKYGNPSSTHYIGEEAKDAIENARKIIAEKINSKRDEIVFTSGGTEGNNIILKGILRKGDEFITTKIEHDSILQTSKFLEKNGIKVHYISVDKKGFVNIDELERKINSKTKLVSVIHGNNEIGTIQNLEEIGKLIKKKNSYTLFHSDACQSFTKVPINVEKMKLDFLTLNSHKIHGPKGVGALYIKKEVREGVTPLIHGGGHEFGLRSGTQDVQGIVGLGKAVSISKDSDVEKISKLRDYVIRELLKIKGVKLNGSEKERLCNNINILIEGVDNETLIPYLDNKGILVSKGSACSSNKNAEENVSHVLKAIGLSLSEIDNCVRISLSKFTTKKEIDYALKEIKKTIGKLRC